MNDLVYRREMMLNEKTNFTIGKAPNLSPTISFTHSIIKKLNQTGRDW